MKRHLFLYIFLLIGVVLKGQTPGSVIITEFMANPAVLNDNEAEWIELYNTTNSAIDLQNWTIRDAATDNHIISPGSALMIGPKSHLLLGRSSDPIKNGGINPAYVYVGFNLNNTGDQIILQNNSGTLVDSVAYGVPVSGYSFNLDTLKYNAADNDIASNWCLSTELYESNNYGTPGKINISCMLTSNSGNEKQNPVIFQTESNIVIHLETNTALNYELYNNNGRLLIKGITEINVKQHQILKTSLIPGIYFLSIDNGLKRYKILVF